MSDTFSKVEVITGIARPPPDRATPKNARRARIPGISRALGHRVEDVEIPGNSAATC